jgi:hypothetical protein
LSIATCFAQKNYYQFSDSILARLAKDTAIGANQYAATDLSYINDYKDVLTVWNRNEVFSDILSPKDSLEFFSRYKPMEARKYILQRAAKSRIVIINEAHHQPMHRVFTESLLQDLHNMGFNYFGAETLSASDTALNRRKYPVLSSGYYTRQPQYGELVRTALKDGYHVFAYEADFRKQHEDKSRTWREQEQAKNIKAILDADPNSRIVIHCGYGHLAEKDFDGKGLLMGGWLKQYTGIDPFTIEQEHFTEQSSPEFERALYKLIKVPYDAVFIDSAGNVYDEEHIYDIMVYHPPTRWIDGRPNWMFGYGRQAYYLNMNITTGYPCLLLAYHADEDPKVAVPADVIELKSKKDKISLALKPGKYHIIARNNKGHEQHIKVTF